MSAETTRDLDTGELLRSAARWLDEAQDAVAKAQWVQAETALKLAETTFASGSDLAAQIAEHKAGVNKKHKQKINRTNALANVMDMLIPMFLKRKPIESLEAFDDIVYKTREIVRPGRKEPRPKKPKKPYNMNYKPI